MRTHPIDKVFRNSTPCLSPATTSRRAPDWSSKEAHLTNTILNQPYRRRVSTDRLNRVDSQLAAFLEDGSDSTSAVNTHLHSKPGFVGKGLDMWRRNCVGSKNKIVLRPDSVSTVRRHAIRCCRLRADSTPRRYLLPTMGSSGHGARTISQLFAIEHG